MTGERSKPSSSSLSLGAIAATVSCDDVVLSTLKMWCSCWNLELKMRLCYASPGATNHNRPLDYQLSCKYGPFVYVTLIAGEMMQMMQTGCRVSFFAILWRLVFAQFSFRPFLPSCSRKAAFVYYSQCRWCVCVEVRRNQSLICAAHTLCLAK